jgi:hypothetical protein
METLPIYVSAVFVLTTLLAALLLHKAGNNSKPLVIAITIWLALQAVVSLTGFYTVTKGNPPRFTLLFMPPVVVIITLLLAKRGRAFIDSFDAKTLTLLHIVRIPVELTLYWLFLHKAVPQIMTFDGRNFDILCGLTAPVVYYFGYIKNVLGRKVILGWNIICLLLLANIVVTAVLSAPLPFQKLAFDQPNVALFYFPFIWLPCFVVPAVLFAHLAAIRRLVK